MWLYITTRIVKLQSEKHQKTTLNCTDRRSDSHPSSHLFKDVDISCAFAKSRGEEWEVLNDDRIYLFEVQERWQRVDRDSIISSRNHDTSQFSDWNFCLIDIDGHDLILSFFRFYLEAWKKELKQKMSEIRAMLSSSRCTPDPCYPTSELRMSHLVIPERECADPLIRNVARYRQCRHIQDYEGYRCFRGLIQRQMFANSRQQCLHNLL